MKKNRITTVKPQEKNSNQQIFNSLKLLQQLINILFLYQINIKLTTNTKEPLYYIKKSPTIYSIIRYIILIAIPILYGTYYYHQMDLNRLNTFLKFIVYIERYILMFITLFNNDEFINTTIIVFNSYRQLHKIFNKIQQEYNLKLLNIQTIFIVFITSLCLIGNIGFSWATNLNQGIIWDQIYQGFLMLFQQIVLILFCILLLLILHSYQVLNRYLKDLLKVNQEDDVINNKFVMFEMSNLSKG